MRRFDSINMPVGARYRYGSLLGGLAALALLGVTGRAQAATIRVDNGSCTLSDAIRAANRDAATGGCTAGAGEDTIVLPRSSSIVLTAPADGSTHGLPAIESVVTIEGNGSTIARDGSAPEFGILTVTWEAALTLNDTIVTGGASLGTFPPAGGISVVYGSLTLNDCVITANTATDLDWGAGIGAYESDVHLNRTTVSGNDGGYGVSVLFGEAVVENSAVVQNEDGGIFGYWTDVRVENTTIASNGGAGVRAHWLDVQNSTVTGNLDTGVVAIAYSLHLANSVVSGNHGTEGREVWFYLPWQPEPGNDFGSTSNNVFGHDGDAGLLNVVPDATDIVPAGPLSSILEPELRANGGPTPTHLLRTTSPARDAGATQFCSAQDQRGVTRPQGAACDIGAVELVPDPCATAVPSSGCTVNGVPNQRCLGTDGADTIVGTTGDDVIVARSGNDVVWARTGNDIVCGGKGDDALHGGGGTDQLWGSQGADSLSGDPGIDSLDGGPGANACSSDGSDVNLISCY